MRGLLEGLGCLITGLISTAVFLLVCYLLWRFYWGY